MEGRRAGFKWLAAFGALALVVLFAIPKRNLVFRNDPETRTRAAVQSFVIGIKAYQTEYNRMPFEALSTRSDRTLQRTSGPILNVLLGKDTAINPREIPFIEPPIAGSKKRGLYYDDQGMPVLIDQWGELFYFVIDLNDDNKIPNPDPRPDQPRELAADIIVFSSGPDRNPSTWKDNIVSW